MSSTFTPEAHAPHPVALDVAFPESLSRWKIFVKLIFAIPQLIVVYLLFAAFSIITFVAWFAILFTGRYPKSFFEFSSGVLRWQANVIAYVALLRDEYPPFSWEPGSYPVAFDVPHAERQSRLRLFIRWFAIIPNQIVFFFVSIAWGFTTLLAWFAILFTARYPRGLFKFAVGSLRWLERSTSYQYMLRDEYPPYSINADARPGNEVLSAIVGVPLMAAYVAFSLLPFFGLLGGGRAQVHVSAALLSTPGGISRERPSGAANNIRLTLTDLRDPGTPPANAHATLRRGYRWVSVRVLAEKAGTWPTFFAPFAFGLRDCDGRGYAIDADATNAHGKAFAIYWRHGHDEKDVYFQFPVSSQVCELRYYAGLAQIRFIFE